jgi:hypothetical protein
LAWAGCTNSSGFASRIFIEPSSNYAWLSSPVAARQRRHDRRGQ